MSFEVYTANPGRLALRDMVSVSSWGKNIQLAIAQNLIPVGAGSTIELLYDRSLQRLAVRFSPEGTMTLFQPKKHHSYACRLRGFLTWVGLPLPKRAARFPAYYDTNQQMIIADLSTWPMEAEERAA